VVDETTLQFQNEAFLKKKEVLGRARSASRLSLIMSTKTHL
jgi:hypothetical protein